MAKTKFKSIREYIASKPKEARGILKQVHDTIRRAVPALEEGISYQIPVLKLGGVPLLYFAGWKEHYSLYPASDALVAAFKGELTPNRVSKGTLRFPLSEPIPERLIARVATLRGREAATGRRKSPRS